MNNSSPHRLLPIVGAMTLSSLVSSCAYFAPHPKGQIVVQAVSWPLVKKLAEPDAGLPGHKVTVQSAEDSRVIAEKTTGASGVLVFDVRKAKELIISAETVAAPPAASAGVAAAIHKRDTRAYTRTVR